MKTKYLSRLEAALWSAGRVSLYASSSYLTGTIATRALTGGSQTPDLETLKGWGIGAMFAGGTALIAFVKNMTKPRSQVIEG